MTFPGRPYFRDLTAEEIEAIYQAALKQIKANRHHELEAHARTGTRELTVRLGVKTT